MTVRYVTPSGMLGSVKITKPKNKTELWKLRNYVAAELRKKGIEFKKFIL